MLVMNFFAEIFFFCNAEIMMNLVIVMVIKYYSNGAYVLGDQYRDNAVYGDHDDVYAEIVILMILLKGQ